MAFGHFIRREREGQAMTLTELAWQVEVSIAYLSRTEREPTPQTEAGPRRRAVRRRR
jgi:hypothetical protein